MSHFSYIKTRILNLEYLKEALNQLGINFSSDNKTLTGYKTKALSTDLLIPQGNGYDIGFNWNGQEYELVADLSFWQQKWSTETFIEKVSQAYATQTILKESNKQGFESIKQISNRDGSMTVVLERWK
jgi:hypothetical protein|tara:strand:+ start:39 stop:422 length:384 start_codon:yes stop_codon:yes gene_type:complete